MERAVICGAGNRNRGDEGIGPESLKDMHNEISGENILFIDCNTSPQDKIKEVLDFRPDNVIIISALDMHKGSGIVEDVEIREATRLLSEDHQIDLEMFIGYLRRALEGRIFFIGFQPWSRKEGHGLSPEARNAMIIIREMVKDIIG